MNAIFRIVKVGLFLGMLSLLSFGCSGGGGGDAGGDNTTPTPPSTPTGLTASPVSISRISLSWNPSTGSPVGYNIYLDGNMVGTVFAATTYTDTGLISNTPYTFTVSAFNANGDESGQSTPASATTLMSATRLLGTTGDDYGRGIAMDSSGNVYITGWTPGNLDGQTGGPDIFLTKYNSSGVRQWTRLLGTTGVTQPAAGDLSSVGRNVAVDSTGTAIYVTGYTTASMDLQPSYGGKDIFLVKYDASGNKVWTRMYGTAETGTTVDDVATSVAVDSRGFIFITGWTTGDLDRAGSGPFGQEDIFLAMYYDFGLTANRSWLLQRGTAQTDIATGIAVDQSGSTYWVYVTGATKGDLGGRTTSTGNYDIFLMQCDLTTESNPVWTWTRMLGTESDDAALAIGTSHEIVNIAGFTGGALDGHTSAGSNDIFVAQYFHDGTKQWTTQLGTAADDLAYGIALDTLGNSYLTGFTSGSIAGRTNAGFEDIFVLKFGFGGGTPIWGTLIGNSADNEGTGIVLNAAQDMLFVTGFTQGNLDGQPNAGGYDMFLMKFDAADGALQ